MREYGNVSIPQEAFLSVLGSSNPDEDKAKKRKS